MNYFFNKCRSLLLMSGLVLGGATAVSGQISGTDAFIKGRYVEVGVASNGTFGSAGSCPPGYHGRSGNSPADAIGFIADPDKDGWLVGTPTFFGDYFLPGGPVEAWGLSVDGTQTVQNRMAGTSGVGSNLSVGTVGSKMQTIWEGTVGNIKMRQTTSVDSDKLYFVVHIQLKNTGTTAQNDIYYGRMLDPDNEQTLTGLFYTRDSIAFQTPNADNKALVVARGSTYGAYLGIGAKDCRAKVFRGPYDPFGYGLPSLYAGTTGSTAIKYSTSDAVTLDDRVVGIVFNIGTLAAGDSTSFAYTYILREPDLDSAFATVSPGWEIGGVSRKNGDTVRACPGTVLPVKVVNGSATNWGRWAPGTGLSDTAGDHNNITVSSGIVTYVVPGVSKATACGASYDTLRLTVASLSLDTIKTNKSVSYCAGATATALSAIAGATDTIKWYDASGTKLAAAPTPATASAAYSVYYVTATNKDGCIADRDTVHVRINPLPLNVTVSASGPLSFCAGDSVTLTAHTDVVTALGTTPWLTAGAAGGTPSTCDCPPGYVAVGYEGRTGSWMDNFRLLCKSISRSTGLLGTVVSGTATNGTSAGGGYNGPYTFAGSEILVGMRVNSQGSYLNGVAGFGQLNSYINAFGNNRVGATALGSLAGATPAIDLGYLWVPDGYAVMGMLSYNASGYSSGVALRYAPIGAFRYTYSWTGGDTMETKVIKTSGTYTLTVTNSLGCSAAAAPVTVTANAIPAAPVATTTYTYCQDDIATALTASTSSASDTLKWYNSAGTPLATAPTPVTTTPGTVTYSVSQRSAAGCESAKTTITVKVNPKPDTAITVTNFVYCQNATASKLSATSAATDTLKWYNGAGVLLSGAPTPPTTTTGDTTFYVNTKNAFGCESRKIAIRVRVNPTPAAPAATASYTYCQGVTATTLTATAVTAADTLKWYAGDGTALSAAPTPATSTPGTFTWTVSQKNNFGCEGPKTTITVKVNPTPAAPIVVSPVNLCIDGPSAALTATAASGNNLLWYTAASGGTGNATAPTPSTLSLGSTKYYVSQKTSLNCEGPRAEIEVIVQPRPAAPVVVTPVDLCIGVPAAALSATGINLKWYTVPTGGTGSATAIVPPTTALGVIDYYVSQTSIYGCEGPRATITVQVHPSPDLHLSPLSAPAFAFCPGAEVTIKATAPTATSFKWFKDAAVLSGASADTLAVGENGWYTALVTDVYGCQRRDSVYAFKDTLPTPTLSPTNVQMCDGVNVMLYCSPGAAGYNYAWFKGWVPMGIPGTNSNTAVNVSGIYNVVVTDIYGCVDTTNRSLVTTYPAVTKPVIDRRDPVLRIVPATYSGYQWYRDGKLIPGATGNSYTMSFDGKYHATVIDINGCGAETDPVTVERLAVPQQELPQVRLYPNPTQSVVRIDCPVPVQVMVTDISGRLILQQQQATEVDLSQVADGMYLFRIYDEKGMPVLIEKVSKSTR